MEKTPEFNKLLEAVTDIAAGKPVIDLEARLSEWGKSCGGLFLLRSGMTPSKLVCFIAWSRYENKILQGANPVDVYGTQNYKEWQDRAQEFLKGILDKYK